MIPSEAVDDPYDRMPDRSKHAASTKRPAAKLETSIGLTMIPIDPRPFTMGSPTGESGRGDNEPAHTVTIGRPYWIAESVVTQAQWMALLP